MTPACAPTSAPSPIRRCPAMAACPPTRTKSSSTVEPEIPTCATMTQHRPSKTLWPICTRLSRREPAPITVSRDDPRSIVVLAPTSTSSSRMTRPSWGTVRNPPLTEANPNPSCPIRAPDRRKRVLPKAHSSGSHVRQSAVSADNHAASDNRAGSDPAAGSYLCPGLNHRQRPDLRRRIDARPLCHNCGGWIPGETGGTG